MEQDFTDDWPIFGAENSSLTFATQPQISKSPDEHSIIKPHREGSNIEEVMSTTHSEVECEKITKPKPQSNTLDCPKCCSPIKPFQYKDDMAIFMCSNTEVLYSLRIFSSFSIEINAFLTCEKADEVMHIHFTSARTCE